MNKKPHNKGPYNVTIIYDAPGGQVVPVEARALSSPPETPAGPIMLPLWQAAALFSVVFGLLTLGGAFPWITGERPGSFSNAEAVVAPVPEDPFQNISLEADAALVFDIVRGETLFEKNAEAQLPLASLAKLMTALIAEETLGDDTVVALDKNAIAEEGDNGLLVDEKWRKEDLIALTLLASSNDGAHALAEAARETLATSTEAMPASFADTMNARAGELGLSQTFFLNAAGLDVHAHESGAYGSARDIARLMAHILAHEPQIFDATAKVSHAFVSLNGVSHLLKNTNDSVSDLPGLVASKTGFTDLAGGNLAVIIEAGPMYPIAIVVLGSTAEERFSDVERLVWAALQKLNDE